MDNEPVDDSPGPARDLPDWLDMEEATCEPAPTSPGPGRGARARRWVVVVAAAVLLIAGLAGWSVLDSAGGEADPGAPPASNVDAPPDETTPSPTPLVVPPQVQVLPDRALLALGSLAVKGKAPSTGYERVRFGTPWMDVDRNGCDTRNDILRRDLDDVVLKPNSNGSAVVVGHAGRAVHGTHPHVHPGKRVVFRGSDRPRHCAQRCLEER